MLCMMTRQVILHAYPSVYLQEQSKYYPCTLLGCSAVHEGTVMHLKYCIVINDFLFSLSTKRKQENKFATKSLWYSRRIPSFSSDNIIVSYILKCRFSFILPSTIYRYDDSNNKNTNDNKIKYTDWRYQSWIPPFTNTSQRSGQTQILPPCPHPPLSPPPLLLWLYASNINVVWPIRCFQIFYFIFVNVIFHDTCLRWGEIDSYVAYQST